VHDKPHIDMDLRAGQFVKLRDMKAEIEERHKDELAPIKQAMDDLKELMKKGLDALAAESVKTSSGTVSFTTKSSAAIADMDAFWTYVVTTGQFELLDRRANVTAVRDHIVNQKNPVPGVNYTEYRDIGVRRPTK